MGGIPDETWTECRGSGFNALGQMLTRLCDAIRQGYDEGLPDAMCLLSFESFGPLLRQTRCRESCEYEAAQ